MKVDLIVGTRPEAIKLNPVFRACQQAELQPRFVVTGQSPIAESFLFDGVPRADVLRDLVRLSRADVVQKREADALGVLLAPVLHALDERWDIDAPQAVIVQGDTLSALAGALVAREYRLPVLHVEAGYRSSRVDAPYPEELCRRLIAQLATLHAAPTKRSARHLEAEHVPGRIVITGNTVVDALYQHPEYRNPTPAPTFDVLITCHRREGWHSILPALCKAVDEMGQRGFHIIWPLHPNPLIVDLVTQAVGREVLAPPMGRSAFLHHLLRAGCVITDSGGVIEEAVTLGVPCLIIRNETERVEALGRTCQLIREDQLWILPDLVEALKGSPRPQSDVFGDGRAAERIAQMLVDHFASEVSHA